jgi:hypothetical protein
MAAGPTFATVGTYGDPSFGKVEDLLLAPSG